MPKPTYARRGQLAAAVRVMPTAQSRTELAAMMAATIEDAVRTFDEFARKLADVDAQLEVAAERINTLDPNEPAPPCADCGERPVEHGATPLLDVAPHSYRAPTPAQALASARAEGRAAGWIEGRAHEADQAHDARVAEYRAPAPALPAWLATGPPCWRCGEPPEAHEEDHEHEPAAVAAITVTYYVTAGPAAGTGDARENVRAIFDSVHDNSTALEALREGLAHAGTPAFLAGTSVPELAP